jgi:hypothetical protein
MANVHLNPLHTLKEKECPNEIPVLNNMLSNPSVNNNLFSKHSNFSSSLSSYKSPERYYY